MYDNNSTQTALEQFEIAARNFDEWREIDFASLEEGSRIVVRYVSNNDSEMEIEGTISGIDIASQTIGFKTECGESRRIGEHNEYDLLAVFCFVGDFGSTRMIGHISGTSDETAVLIESEQAEESEFDSLEGYTPYTTSASWNSDVEPSEPDDRLGAAEGATFEDALRLVEMAADLGIDIETNYLAYLADSRSEFPAGSEHSANAQARFINGEDPVSVYLESEGYNGFKSYDTEKTNDRNLEAFGRANLIAGRSPFVDPRNVSADVTRVYSEDLENDNDNDDSEEDLPVLSERDPVIEYDQEFVSDISERRECAMCGSETKRVERAVYFKHNGETRICEIWKCLGCETGGNILRRRSDGEIVRLSHVHTGTGFEHPLKAESDSESGSDSGEDDPSLKADGGQRRAEQRLLIPEEDCELITDGGSESALGDAANVDGRERYDQLRSVYLDLIDEHRESRAETMDLRRKWGETDSTDDEIEYKVANARTKAVLSALLDLEDLLNDWAKEHSERVVDSRPPICPNDGSLLAPTSENDVECPDCGYTRRVLEPEEPEDEELVTDGGRDVEPEPRWIDWSELQRQRGGSERLVTDGGERIPEKGETAEILFSPADGVTTTLVGEVSHASYVESRVYDSSDDETGHMEPGISGQIEVERPGDGKVRRIRFNTASRRVVEHHPGKADPEEAIEFLGTLRSISFSGGERDE